MMPTEIGDEEEGEDWSDGVLECCCLSITPLLHYSITPLLHPVSRVPHWQADETSSSLRLFRAITPLLHYSMASATAAFFVFSRNGISVICICLSAALHMS